MSWTLNRNSFWNSAIEVMNSNILLIEEVDGFLLEISEQ